MRYLVRAKVKPGQEKPLLEAIESGALGRGSVAGDEYLEDMAKARIGADGVDQIHPISNSPLGLSGPRRIKFKFRNCRFHLIPWLDIGNENIHLRTKPAWIIQAASGDSNESC